LAADTRAAKASSHHAAAPFTMVAPPGCLWATLLLFFCFLPPYYPPCSIGLGCTLQSALTACTASRACTAHSAASPLSSARCCCERHQAPLHRHKPPCRGRAPSAPTFSTGWANSQPSCKEQAPQELPRRHGQWRRAARAAASLQQSALGQTCNNGPECRPRHPHAALPCVRASCRRRGSPPPVAALPMGSLRRGRSHPEALGCPAAPAPTASPCRSSLPSQRRRSSLPSRTWRACRIRGVGPTAHQPASFCPPNVPTVCSPR
jgi:hypothetical protein